jgi:hypothetical protein
MSPVRWGEMTIRPFLPAALPAALLLAACSGSDDPAGEPETVETMMPVEPDGGIGDGVGPPAPVTADIVPADYLGAWDYVEGTCDPASDLRVEIGPRSMQFYESYGEITRIVVESPRDIVVSLAMEGEGEQWQMKRRFTLSDDGNTLTPSAVDDEPFEPMPLKKCE